MGRLQKAFYLLMVGEVISGVGMWLAIIGNLQFMQGLIESDFIKSLILMTGVFASVICLPLIGRIIDQFDKRLVLVSSSLLRLLGPAAMFPALAYDSISWMIVSLVVTQVAGAAYFPTVRAALPVLVQRDQLLRANTIYMNVITISRIAGTALAGVMVATMSLHNLFMSALIGYVLLLLITTMIRIPKSERVLAQQAQGKPKEKVRFSEVFTVLKQEPSVMLGLVMGGVITLFLGGFNLLALSFGEAQQSDTLISWIYTIEGMSILIAGLFVRRLIAGANLVLVSSLLLFLFAIAEFGMSFADSRIIVLVSFYLFGTTIAFFFPTITTIYQKRLDESIQGRFFSFKEMLERILMQVSLLVTGASLDLIGVTGYMLLIATITLSIGIFAFLTTKKRVLDVRQHIEAQSTAS